LELINIFVSTAVLRRGRHDAVSLMFGGQARCVWLRFG
jgi:hypothetical protein